MLNKSRSQISQMEIRQFNNLFKQQQENPHLFYKVNRVLHTFFFLIYQFNSLSVNSFINKNGGRNCYLIPSTRRPGKWNLGKECRRIWIYFSIGYHCVKRYSKFVHHDDNYEKIRQKGLLPEKRNLNDDDKEIDTGSRERYCGCPFPWRSHGKWIFESGPYYGTR